MELRQRWTTPDGAARRERILGAIKGEWRAHAIWDPEGDARPDLRGIDLTRQRLSGVDLSGTRLDHAVLDEADLSDASIARASLHEASLARICAPRLDAFAASLYACTLDTASLPRAIFCAANLARASLRRVRLDRADLRGATLHGAELLGCSLDGARLTGADVETALIVGCRGHTKSRHEQDSIDQSWPLFAPLVRYYTTLMGSLPARVQTIAEGCISGGGDPITLLLAGNWRVTLAGVAAAIVRGPEEHVIEQLWSILRRGSWASPQVACAAALLDPRFDDKARAFVTPDYRFVDKLYGRPQPMPPPKKSLISVYALIEKDGLPAGVDERSEESVAAKIARSWLARVRAQLIPIVQERIDRGRRRIAGR